MKDWFSNSLRLLDVLFDFDGYYDVNYRSDTNRLYLGTQHELFNKIIRCNKIRDSWLEPKVFLLPVSTTLVEISQKMGTEISIGVSVYGYFIDANITHWETLNKMGDDFWELVTQIGLLGTADIGNACHSMEWGESPRDQYLLRFNKSLVYRLMRDYVFTMQDESNNSSVGNISVRIPVNSEESQVELFYREGIRLLYRMNYMLYRRNYIDSRRKKECP
jgi:hypothetical protein